MANATNDDFYVGYLPAPAGHRRFMIALVPVLLLLVGVGAVLIAAGQRDPGGGVWSSDTIELRGIAYATPYAMLRTTDGNAEGSVRTVLLVSEGKFGAVERVKALDGQPVAIRGTMLQRDSRKLLEIESSEDAVKATDSLPAELVQRLQRRMPETLGQITLRGEIIDPKCYSGAMKPGSGKTHKACGTLCIMGGIPPMFVTRDEQLRDTFHLLTDESGGAIREPILPFIGDDVEVTGRLERQDDLLILKLGQSAVRRTP